MVRLSVVEFALALIHETFTVKPYVQRLEQYAPNGVFPVLIIFMLYKLFTLLQVADGEENIDPPEALKQNFCPDIK